jgi:hypothetical protein
VLGLQVKSNAPYTALKKLAYRRAAMRIEPMRSDAAQV